MKKLDGVSGVILSFQPTSRLLEPDSSFSPTELNLGDNPLVH